MNNHKKYLKFSFDMCKEKPININNQKIICPFCNKKNLDDILDKEDEMLLVKNKFPTLENTFQTVLIETDTCDENILTYSKEYMRKLIKFAIKNWFKIKNSNKFESVIFFKNHGELSGGSIKHSHMQIVGLKDINYKENMQEEYFKGLIINKNNHGEVNISTSPIVGFSEFNVIINDTKNIDYLADNIKTIVHYILEQYPFKCESYNLFFYHFNGKIICKIVPRFVTSPVYIGYNISQVSDKLTDMAKKIKNLYY